MTVLTISREGDALLHQVEGLGTVQNGERIKKSRMLAAHAAVKLVMI